MRQKEHRLLCKRLTCSALGATVSEGVAVVVAGDGVDVAAADDGAEADAFRAGEKPRQVVSETLAGELEVALLDGPEAGEFDGGIRRAEHPPCFLPA